MRWSVLSHAVRCIWSLCATGNLNFARASDWLLCRGGAEPANQNAAATDHVYVVRTTGDLATFYKAAQTDQTDSYYVAATNLCHGFAVGVYGMLEEEIQACRACFIFFTS